MTTAPHRPRDPAVLTAAERARRIDALTRLVALIVHDNNNLLAAIMSNVRSLSEAIDEAHDGRRYLDNLTRDVAFATPRTEALRAYLEDGLAVFEPVTAGILLSDVKTAAATVLPPNCGMEIDHGASLPPIPMARKLVHRALLNAVRNAGDAMLESGGTVRLAATLRHGNEMALDDIFLLEHLRPEPMLCLDIVNDGPPVSAETRERLFDPGFSTRLRAPGLGLCAVLGAMRTHRGCMAVPLQGNGFTLSLLLPLTAPPRTARLP